MQRHRGGGAVIMGAAADNEKVRALVYVAAFAPDDAEPVGFHDIFASELPPSMTRVMSASQKPLIASAFGESTHTRGLA